MEETRTKVKVPSQKDMVLGHLRRYGSIEPLTALREYGCYRLGAVIYELRREGEAIETTTVESRSRITGRPVQFAKYRLKEEPASPQHGGKPLSNSPL